MQTKFLTMKQANKILLIEINGKNPKVLLWALCCEDSRSVTAIDAAID